MLLGELSSPRNQGRRPALQVDWLDVENRYVRAGLRRGFSVGTPLGRYVCEQRKKIMIYVRLSGAHSLSKFAHFIDIMALNM